MPPAIALKNKAREDILVRGRILIAGLGVIALILVLVSRLVHLQVMSHEHFRTLSEDNRVKIMPEAPTRGLVYDRNGVILAQNQPSYSLELIPEVVEDMDATLDALGEVVQLDPADIERFRKLLARKRPFESIPLRFRLGEQEVARFAVNRHRFPGVDIHARLTRHYPLGQTGAHVVGYVGRIDEQELREVDAANYSGTSHIGKTGVERAYEEVLHGRVGYQHVESNAQGRRLRTLEHIPPVPGSDLYLHLDAGLQRAAEAALGEESGAIVALDPRNGGVLALASTPTFDPNLFVNGIDVATYRDLSRSPRRPLFNRALRGQYPPGSTVKPFYGLAGIHHGIELAGSETYCPGFYQLPGSSRRYRDWKRTGHGEVDLEWAVVRSCDVYFYELAQDLGIERMHRFMTIFDFGRATGIDLVGEESGLMPSRAWKRAARNQAWYPGETLIAGIGQGFMLSTPLQLAVATAGLANRGVIHEPRVVRALGGGGSEEIRMVEPVRRDRLELRDPEGWDRIRQSMVDAVHAARGTAHRIAEGLEYRIAGKTGTAQVFGLGEDDEYDPEKLPKRLWDHALFVAFAPAEAPRIALAVVVENGGGGSSTAAPMARRVLDHYLTGAAAPAAPPEPGAAAAAGAAAPGA
jgi:penicillin-binding protein 2